MTRRLIPGIMFLILLLITSCGSNPSRDVDSEATRTQAQIEQSLLATPDLSLPTEKPASPSTEEVASTRLSASGCIGFKWGSGV